MFANEVNDGMWSEIESQRGWLFLLAVPQLSAALRRKVDPDDIVQETMIRAHKAIVDGNAPADPLSVKAWLIQIMKNVLIDQWRHYTSDKRDLGKEKSVLVQLEQSAAGVEAWLAADHTSPSLAAQRNERIGKLAHAIQLLPADVREVVVEKHLNSNSLEEIAVMTGRTVPSVAGLLRRGLAAIREVLE